MGLFDFLKPKKVKDDFFGELTFSYGKNSFFEGEKTFKPTMKKVGLTIESANSGPTKEQKDFFNSIEKNYTEIKQKSTPLIIEEFIDWKENFVIKNFDEEFTIESFTIPRIGTTPIFWEISYTTIHDKDHWIIINLSDFEPKSVMIDG